MTRRATIPAAILAVFATAGTAAAQDVIEFPTHEKYVEEMEEALALPLFTSHEPIKMTLTTDIKWLRDERPDTIETDGTLSYVDMDGVTKETVLEVRTRGNWRRDKRNCNFPPLRLDFDRSEMEGTVFESQDKLKLVTPCHDGRDSYQDYVLKEYLGYRAYNAITPMSHRVRLVEITYVDINDDYDSRTKIGFLIESDEHMAERNMATHEDVAQFHPGRLDGASAVVTATFNYMLGFTDVSQVYFHNAKLIRTEDAKYVPVSYDFDFSGMVNARYATPDPKVPIRNVRQRIYRGYCRPEIQYETISAQFNDARDEIWAAVQGLELLDEDRREDVLEYFEDFYEVMDDPRKFEREITRACLNW